MIDENNHLLNIIESLILTSDEPITLKKLNEVIEQFISNITSEDIKKGIDELNKKYNTDNYSFFIKEIAGGFKYYIKPQYSQFAKYLNNIKRRRLLSKAGLETLAIIAYKQPITRTEIENIRGVNSDNVIRNLMEKGLITISGRADAPGQPMLYSTTNEFLELLGINKLKDLPKLSEFETMLENPEELFDNDNIQVNISNELEKNDENFNSNEIINNGENINYNEIIEEENQEE